ncbi:hypothetical protein M0811_05518 [Anaeramoeba ignava]|uniref:Phosphatidic acid phosphatase type 2/haloperoxidase domain-containing protein n=1 Tax=Anaeramoeba ignava TaxID=1746090 RepID=A0A9Q0LUS7_ANAIG|nr:hypothetical protein M0811_05518 [Anaeramoeba ignava]
MANIDEEQTSLLDSNQEKPTPKFPYKRPAKFCYEIPKSITNFFRPFDMKIIQLCQKHMNKFTHIFSLIMTPITTIEVGLTLPFILYIFGIDELALEFLNVMFIFSFLTQIPKRFLWRFRPYIVGDALRIRKDSSSSFPSRAVAGAVVYPYLANYLYAYFHNNEKLKISWLLILIIILFVIWTSYSRIYFGVHYPTDCIAGLIIGIIVCVSSANFYHMNSFGCQSCWSEKCYTNKEDSRVINWNNFDNVHWIVFVITTAVSFVITLFLNMKPIEFWAKIQHAFAQMFSAYVFHFTLLCTSSHLDEDGKTLSPPSNKPTWVPYFLCVFIIPIQLILGMKLKGGIKSIASFTIIFTINFLVLFFWRIIAAKR